MDRFYWVSLIIALVSCGCDSSIAPTPITNEPSYQVVVPDDLPLTVKLDGKGSDSRIVNARETYLAKHRQGWDSYLFELRISESQKSGESGGSNDFTSNLDLPFPQTTGYEMGA